MWSLDTGSLVVCTDLGDILILDFQGGYKQYLIESPRGCKINSIVPFDKGLIVAGAHGQIWTYESLLDENYPYKLMQSPEEMEQNPKI
jgi:hypothetical protein